MSDKTLLLVDGSSYLYRAYHALPDLRSAGGFPTGAIHGVAAMLKLLRKQYDAALGACVFDAPGKTFRDDWYAEYKATRTAMPDDLAQQIAPIHEVVRMLGWPVLMVPGIEADDAIGTLARLAGEAGWRVVVSTGDKDLAQLVNERVTLVNTMAKPPEVLDIAAVTAKFGVPPERIVDYLTLVGDTVDNVPGVDKVGPKTAAKWIVEHGSLEGVMAASADMKGVVGENLRKALDWLPQGRRLVTIATDCDLVEHVAGWPSLDALAFRPVERDALLAFYGRYDFKAWRKELENTPPDPKATATAAAAVPAAAAPIRASDLVLAADALEAWAARVAAAPVAAFALQTDSPDGVRAQIVGIALATADGDDTASAYIPLRHGYAGAPDLLPADAVLVRLKPWLEDAGRTKVAHDIKLACHALASAGIALRGELHDTMLQSYVLEAHKPHTLESLVARHLGGQAPLEEDLCGKGVNRIAFGQVDVERACEYAGRCAALTLQVHGALWPQLQAQAGLLYVYRDIEVPTSGVLCRMERNGVLIDAATLARQSADLAERIVALERRAFEIAGQPFNLGSPKQIGEILFGKLGLPVRKKTASGAPSTDEEVLQELAADFPLPATLLEHRSLSKLKGTYTDKLPLMVNPATGRVHTNYAQAVAVTGRLSSNEPNLQNIPIRTAEGRRVREAFVAAPGHVVLSADYSQIELRLMAHISEDPALLNAFAQGIDVHRATASEVFSVPVAEVSSEHRRYAKVINFGLIYGMGAFGLASNLGIEQKAARDYIERYFTRFAGVKRYMDDTRRLAREHGYVETLFGRRIYLPDINGGNGPRKSGAERQAINAPMQGTAADLVKLAMIATQATLERERRATKMLLQVHDELLFEVPDDEVDWARTEVPRIMAAVAELKVPLLAQVGVGRNWDEAH